MALHLFHGSETYLVDLAFRQAWTGLTGDLASDLDAEMIDGGAGIADVVLACTSVGFFSPVRVVGVRDWRLLAGGGRKPRGKKAAADHPLEAAAAALAALPEGSTLVSSVSSLLPPTHPVLRLAQSKGRAMGFPRMNPRDVPAWTTRRARELGVAIDGRAIELLVRRAGVDLGLLDNELTKLGTYAGQERVGTREVELLVPDTAEHQVWDLTDSLLANPGRAALELDRALAAGEPAGRLNYMLVRHLRLLLAASAAPAGQAGARALAEAFSGDGRPLSDYSISKAQQQSRGVPLQRLEAIYRRAASSEAAQRRGDMDEETALRMLVMEAAMSAGKSS